MGHTFSSGPKAEKLLSQVPSQCLLLALGQGVTGWQVRVSLPLPELSLWHDESVTASQKVTLKPAQSLRGVTACWGSLCCGVPQTYIRSMDKDFVAATIQAIGRCATNIGRVRDTCLNGLVQLLSNRDGQCLSVWL